MARPSGKRMSGTALRDVLRLRGLSMTEAAERCGIGLTTLSGLAKGDHNASDKTVRSIADGLEVSEGTLFPELIRFVYVDLPSEAELAAVAS